MEKYKNLVKENSIKFRKRKIEKKVLKKDSKSKFEAWKTVEDEKNGSISPTL